MGAKSLIVNGEMMFYPTAELAAMRLEYRPRFQDEVRRIIMPRPRKIIRVSKKP